MTLGKQIKRARTAIGISQQAIADKFGISRAAVAQWELDRTRPDQDKLVQLAAILRTSVGVLLEDGWTPDGSGASRRASPEIEALTEAWNMLTPDERAELLADIQRRSAHNRTVIEAFGRKSEQAKPQQPKPLIERRSMGAVYFGYPVPDRRKKERENES